MSVFCVVMGWITTLAAPTSAQSPVEQLPAASEETKDALGAVKNPIANPISTSDHFRSGIL